VSAGVDLVIDGEMSKISYATYIKDRITGFEGDSPRTPPSDLEEFPGFLERQASSGGTPSYKRPCCVAPIEVKSMQPLKDDLANFKAALDGQKAVDGFMNAASPGVIALFQPDQHYKDHETYLMALADAMQAEYEAIVNAGYILQLDSPDLGLGRHMMFKGRNDDEYRQLANLHVEALNHALRNVPAERVRMHICWGNYEGPHHHDAPMEMVLPIALKAKPQGLLFENSNPRHAHEWTVFAEMDLPDDKVLIPGVVDSTTNFVEHPELVAQRILRFTDIVGAERVIAGTDCGFSTFAGFGAVDEDIVYAKLASMAEGAARASDVLGGKS
jgi:5-methyltetrahydropteroyltriglutamate--homocysteine methyltransferase